MIVFLRALVRRLLCQHVWLYAGLIAAGSQQPIQQQRCPRCGAIRHAR
jgi:hypothetical protein